MTSANPKTSTLAVMSHHPHVSNRPEATISSQRLLVSAWGHDNTSATAKAALTAILTHHMAVNDTLAAVANTSRAPSANRPYSGPSA